MADAVLPSALLVLVAISLGRIVAEPLVDLLERHAAIWLAHKRPVDELGIRLIAPGRSGEGFWRCGHAEGVGHVSIVSHACTPHVISAVMMNSIVVHSKRELCLLHADIGGVDWRVHLAAKGWGHGWARVRRQHVKRRGRSADGQRSVWVVMI